MISFNSLFSEIKQIIIKKNKKKPRIIIALDINYQPCYQEQIISNTINNISDNTNLIRVMYWENDIGKLKPITKCCEIK